MNRKKRGITRVLLGFLFMPNILCNKVPLRYNNTIRKELQTIMPISLSIGISDVQSSSIGTTAHCGLWLVEKSPSIFSCLPSTVSIFSLPALEDLFPSFPGSSPSSRPFQFLSEVLFGHPILLHSL